MQDDDEPAKTFLKAFQANIYPDHAFKFFAADKVKALIDGVRPDVLAARAQAADKTLNNQGLAILFSFGGKNLVFAGDAQWRQWENLLYGGGFRMTGHAQLMKQAKEMLKRHDLCKDGHERIRRP